MLSARSPIMTRPSWKRSAGANDKLIVIVNTSRGAWFKPRLLHLRNTAYKDMYNIYSVLNIYACQHEIDIMYVIKY